MRFVFRADGNAEIGLGHITRCLALAHMLKRYGDVQFISKPLPIKLPFEVHTLPTATSHQDDIEITREVLTRLKPDVVIVDHHDLDQRYLDSIKAFTSLLIAIDDLKREICADVMVNVNTFSLKMNYKCARGKVLLGPRYALIRKIRPRTKVRTNADRVLVSMGGADVLNLTPKVIRALKGIRNIHATVVVGAAFKNQKNVYSSVDGDKRFSVVCTDDLPSLMLKHDIAVCGGGTTLYELAATGTPAIILCQAENQFINARELNKKTLVSLGMGDATDTNMIKSAVETLLNDYGIRRRLSTNGKKLVDGKGKERVTKIILTELKNRRIDLKPARIEDTIAIWKWRNEKTVRMNSFNTRPIHLKKHLSWFSHALCNRKKRIFVIYNNKSKIGFVRIDMDTKPEINIAVGKRYRRLGFGSRAIRLACELVNRKNIIAKLKRENMASIKAFERAGFKISEKRREAIIMELDSFL